MTLRRTLTLLLAAVAIAVCPGCRKKPPPGPKPYNINDVNIDMPKLSMELANASPEVKAKLTELEVTILRFRAYDKALVILDGLANDPTLNDSQKKTVSQVSEQVKQLMNQSGPK